KLHDGSRIRELYGDAVVYERHRHRYEVNNHLRRRLESAGLVCSGTSPDDRLVEAIELARDVHPFYVASQYHPEFKSRPERPAPLFREFVGAALARAEAARSAAEPTMPAAQATAPPTAPTDVVAARERDGDAVGDERGGAGTGVGVSRGAHP
ncbi:MAG TPA: hypothetical protein VGI07_07160, partial [Solirubrobacteraceae bacterium]